MLASVNVGSFVTVRPCVEGDGNFETWKQQMDCLLKSQEVADVVYHPPKIADGEWVRMDSLVKGWILGSIGGEALRLIVSTGERTRAWEAWFELEDFFNRQDYSVGEGDDPESSRYLPLRKAAMRGDLDAVIRSLASANEAAVERLGTKVVSATSETLLHVAVSTGRANKLVNKLVEMAPADALDHRDSGGRTALHCAAFSGNKAAAIALVKKKPNLLLISNQTSGLPVLGAAINCHKETLEYLLSEHEAEAEHSPFLPDQHQNGITLFNAIIASEYVG